MIEFLLRRTRFLLERWVQRGVLFQLMLMVALVVAVAVAGGVAAWALTPSFDHLPAAMWWAFLRLTDPGYLGDDEGTVLRVVSTIVTVLGYVLFMGSLIAIMTQWLARTIRRLESGITPISMEQHIVILGWTNRTPETIKKLLTARGRLDRFLARIRSGRVRIVILAEDVDAQRRLDLRSHLGADWNESQIYLRSGSSLAQDDLERLDLPRAAVVVVPASDFEMGGAELTDTRVVKTLLTLNALLVNTPEATTPHIVAEVIDPRKVSLARGAITTPTEIIASDRLISRLLSQSLRHRGISAVLFQLLTHREGQGLYLRSFPELVGTRPVALWRTFRDAIVVGVARPTASGPAVTLDPAEDMILEPHDLLILIAERYDLCVPDGCPPPQDTEPTALLRLTRDNGAARQRVLILGWSFKIRTLLTELLESHDGGYDITIMSRVDDETRRQTLSHLDLSTERLRIEHVEGDYTLEHDFSALQPEQFDHVLFLASSLMGSSEAADARTVLGYLLLKSLLKGSPQPPEILVELLDPDSARILGEGSQLVFVSPRIMSHLLAHVSLRPELNAVFDALICAGGASIELRSPADLGLPSGPVTFADIQRTAAERGFVGLGFLGLPPNDAPHIELNPPRDRPWTPGPSDHVILLGVEHEEPPA